jgi:DNA-binding NtrC family response regulator
MSDTRAIRVLLIEDNENDAILIRTMLSESQGPCFELDCVDKLSAAVDRLGSGVYDVVLSDLRLPDSTGIVTLGQVQKAAGASPVIVLSGYQSEELAVKAVREGAQDYLVKGSFDVKLLVRSILYSIERKKNNGSAGGRRKRQERPQKAKPEMIVAQENRDDDGSRSAGQVENAAT